QVYCLTINRSVPVTFTIYRDANDNLKCEAGTDTVVDTLILDDSISIPTCSYPASPAYWNPPYFAFFFGDGKIKLINTTTGSQIKPNPLFLTYPDYEIILSSNKLASGRKAREVEMIFGLGKIEVSAVRKTGYRKRIAGVAFAPVPKAPYMPDMPGPGALVWCE
ncbi:MAG TPA: hypothetical protein VI895_02405, partial [Bdellovibrionota bacterium]|nr:hypothetical protein [Bdellovibrionota bacterium]